MLEFSFLRTQELKSNPACKLAFLADKAAQLDLFNQAHPAYADQQHQAN
jgi:hypothetical protein